MSPAVSRHISLAATDPPLRLHTPRRSPRSWKELMLQRNAVIAMLSLLARPAAVELRIPCLWNPFGGCSFTFVSPEYAKRPVQALNPQSALAAINAFRVANGVTALVLDERLSRAAAMQSQAQAGSGWIGHYGPGSSTPKDRAARAMDPGAPRQRIEQRAPATKRRLPRRMLLQDRSLSGMQCIFGRKVPAIGLICRSKRDRDRDRDG